MDKSNLELVGKILEIKQSPYSSNVLDIILIMERTNGYVVEESDKFSLLIYKVNDFDYKNLIVGEKVYIKGKVCSNLFRNCKYRRRVMIMPTEIKLIEGSDK